MRHFLFFLFLLLPTLSLAQEEIEYKEYSYTEFFQMIEDEESKEFKLSNALIIPDLNTDKRFFTYINSIESDREMKLAPIQDTIVVEKALILDNVQFLIDGNETGNANAALSYIHFKNNVRLTNNINSFFTSSTFDKKLIFRFTPKLTQLLEFSKLKFLNTTTLSHCKLKDGIRYFINSFSYDSDFFPVFFTLNSSVITTPMSDDSVIQSSNQIAYSIYGNRFNGEGTVRITNDGADNYFLLNNRFEAPITMISLNSLNKNKVTILGNSFDHYVGLDLNALPENSTFQWHQFENKSLSAVRLYEAISNVADSIIDGQIYTLNNLKKYANQARVKDELYYKEEQKLKGYLMRFYKTQNDHEFGNAVYLESKDLETKRLGHLHQSAPTFNTFFTLKINQFLKIFSDYGTRPSKAIIFSVYVILAFTLVYLFFPNHWDSHGKDRILHRYQFFFKYLNKDAGMHDVYLDGKKDELAHYDGFKNFFLENGKTVPKFFLATALPLYRWSTASTRSSSWFLQKIDIFKGKWADLPAPQRAAKTVLLSLAFAIALLYDIFIKILNALMLSINTFTTLGFGEIPIKGLPRYLAIIQGFIGWFMLTIFSVSLISQLLN